jgi:hypothetical protein
MKTDQELIQEFLDPVEKAYENGKLIGRHGIKWVECLELVKQYGICSAEYVAFLNGYNDGSERKE